MTSRRIKVTSISLFVVLAMSGLSFGFLVGRANQTTAQTTEQMQTVTAKVNTGGAVVAKVVNGIRHMLIQ